MSQDESSKTEAPSPKKLRDAREEGNVAKSRDLSMFVAILALLLYFAIARHFLVGQVFKIYDIIFNTSVAFSFEQINLFAILFTIVSILIKLLIPVVLIGGFAAGITTLIQLGGFLFATKMFKFDLQKFNIANNFMQIFGKKSWIKFFFNVLKITIMLFVGYQLFIGRVSDLVLLPNLDFISIVSFILYVLFKIILVLLGIFAAFSLFDFILERHTTYKKLMMSIEELKKEYKETNGSPEIKQRQREFAYELLNDDDGFGAHREFMFVLANPTHIAIVVLYKPTQWKLPITVMKSKNYAAQVVFRMAKTHKVPIIREKWLARQLYAFAEINQFVPKTLVKDVATVIGKNIDLLPGIAKEMELIKTGFKLKTDENPLDVLATTDTTKTTLF